MIKPRAAVPFKTSLATAIALAAFASTLATAQPTAYTRPNTTTATGAATVNFSGQNFINHGLQGVSRLSATATRDFNGDTFGAFSALDIVPGSWRKTANGYSGTLFSLPDRGPNGVGSVNFSNYPGRISTFAMAFNPYTSSTNLPVSAASQQQLVLTQTGGFFFRDFSGNLTTGLDPGTGATAFVTQSGKQFPGSTTGAAAGKIALDAEGIRILNNGNMYVSDEYGANVYYFDKTGRMLGAILPPPAVAPRTADGSTSFSSVTNAVTGRRLNQGLEGLALTPDNKKLVTLLQSATMQDSNTANQETRTNTRLMIYDIANNATPTAPTAHYVLQLPVFTSNGNGGVVNRTAAQSELLALNDNQFLVLARDGNGLGQANLNPVYKSILLVDTTGATNIAGTAFETTTTPISPNGVLNSSIKPVSQVEVVNMLNTTQLDRFGLNINNTTPTRLTLTEKMEGMALVPVLDESAPQDYFLMIGNDNDFLSSNCSVGGENCAQPVDSDALVLVYRLTLPTYVDSQHLQALNTTAPVSLGINELTARDMATTSTDAITQHLTALRHTEVQQSVWLNVGGRSRDEDGFMPRLHGTQFTVGLDATPEDNILVGIAAGYFSGDSRLAGMYGADNESFQLTAYGSYTTPNVFVNVAASGGNLDFDNIMRPAAYGLTATGNTRGNSTLLSAEAGYLFETGALRLGPVAGVQWLSTDIDNYTETGASGSNLTVAASDSDKAFGHMGGEAAMAMGNLRGVLRVLWHEQNADDTLATTAKLASANHAMASQSLTVSTLAQDYTEVSLTLTELQSDKLNWWLNYGARIGADEGTEHQLSAGIKLAF